MQIYLVFKVKGVVATTPYKTLHITANLSWSSNQGIYKVLGRCLETKQGKREQESRKSLSDLCGV